MAQLSANPRYPQALREQHILPDPARQRAAQTNFLPPSVSERCSCGASRMLSPLPDLWSNHGDQLNPTRSETMLKHALVAVDFSDEGSSAVQFLGEIAGRLGIERLTVAYVIPTQQRPEKKEAQRAVRKRELEDLAAAMARDYGVPVDHRLGEGLVAETLLSLAREQGADLVVCANRSRSRSRQFFIGNVALNLARMSRLPLLIMPVEREAAADGPILLATDGSPAATGAEQLFARVGGNGPAEVLWVDTGADDEELSAKSRVAELIAPHAEGRSRVLKGDPDDIITQVAREGRAAVIIMGKRGSTPIKELPLGSTAEAVCRTAYNPVLLVPSV
jgi:nucleotide-binding universal stress UspA family protein